jgi:diguanylate cyclase (GGDEF)-like protein
MQFRSSDIDQSTSRILIADDDPAILLLLKHILLAEGYSVIEASNGAEVIDCCNNNELDLAIIDIVMPEIDGIEACRTINEQLTNPPPILMITALDDDISVETAFDAGAVDYVNKPINWSVFKNRVKRMVNAEKSRKTIRKLEYHDSLTGLPNRVLLLDRLESAIYRAKRGKTHVALFVLDIDNFKLINETLGHEQGDMVLKSVADRLQSHIRDTDTLSRTSGDEFGLIIENIERVENVAHLVENLTDLLEHSVVLEHRNVYIKAKMGITLYPQDGEDVGTLLRNADIALHRAKKENGQTCYRFFSPELSSKAFRRLNIENNLRDAIDKDQLILHYQPKIHLSSGHPQGMEALVRWNHPEHGLIPPEEFIGIAEETGLIVPLGEWVIRTACKQFCTWRKDKLNINNISINVSARQFKEHDLVSLFREILNSCNIEPSYIELELTESALLNNEDHAESKLSQLHDMGIKISIDDFGTGYASLSYLKRLPIDILKIDRSFTDGILHDSDDIAIVNAITGLANALGLELVAEGIETAEQLDKIMSLGIGHGQGYFWSPPCSAEDYLSLFRRLSTPESD